MFLPRLLANLSSSPLICSFNFMFNRRQFNIICAADSSVSSSTRRGHIASMNYKTGFLPVKIGNNVRADCECTWQGIEHCTRRREIIVINLKKLAGARSECFSLSLCPLIASLSSTCICSCLVVSMALGNKFSPAFQHKLSETWDFQSKWCCIVLLSPYFTNLVL